MAKVDTSTCHSRQVRSMPRIQPTKQVSPDFEVMDVKDVRLLIQHGFSIAVLQFGSQRVSWDDATIQGASQAPSACLLVCFWLEYRCMKYQKQTLLFKIKIA